MSPPAAADGRGGEDAASCARPRVDSEASTTFSGSSNGSGARRAFKPYHSENVPRSANLGDTRRKAQQGGSPPVTTMMLRNIPNKYTQNSLLQEIDAMGFAGLYDFFYLPMDVHNRSNVGYAFINFLEPTAAERFLGVFKEHRFRKHQSRKISSVSPAHVQGLDANLRHFENRAVTHARNDQYRPVVLQGAERRDFEQAVAEAKARAVGGAVKKPGQPAAPCRGAEVADDDAPRQGGLVDAAPRKHVRGSGFGPGLGLERPDAGTQEAPVYVDLPPGLPAAAGKAGAAPQVCMTLPAAGLLSSDIGDLLSLRSLLVDRLQAAAAVPVAGPLADPFPAAVAGAVAGAPPPLLSPSSGLPAYVAIPAQGPAKIFAAGPGLGGRPGSPGSNRAAPVKILGGLAGSDKSCTAQDVADCVTPRTSALMLRGSLYDHIPVFA